MAALVRVVAKGARCISSNSIRQIRFQQPACMISTSKKNKDAVVATENSVDTQPQENLLDKEEVSCAVLTKNIFALVSSSWESVSIHI